MEPDDKPGHLVCAPASGPVTIPGSSFDRHCYRCEQLVMIAPSGQQILKENPGLSVICVPCFRKTAPPEAKINKLTPEQTNEMLGPVKRNTWRRRN